MYQLICIALFTFRLLAQCPKDCSSNGICDPYMKLCFCNSTHVLPDCSLPISQKKSCPQPCINGHCDYLSGTCKCRDDFSGAQCEIQQNNCPGNCNGDLGICQNEKCQCVWPMEGPDCKQYACENNCYGNGVCIAKNKCTCNKGFVGDLCFFRIIE